jgi:vacuolar-type H+-ATPase subunit H
MSTRTGDAGDEAHQASGLAELLACERELDELMSAVRTDARRRVADALSQVAHAEAELEASLAEEAERARRELREETQARVRDVSSRARVRVTRFESVSDDEVARLAESAFRRLLDWEGDGT